MSTRLLGAKQHFNKERFQQGENLRSARCSPFVNSNMLAARMRKLITACARKNKRTACILANARKDHSVPLKYIYLVSLINYHVSKPLQCPLDQTSKTERFFFLIYTFVRILFALSGRALICNQLFNVNITRLYETRFHFPSP